MSTSRRGVEQRGGEWDDIASMTTSSHAHPPDAPTTDWHVVVPVKDTSHGKSRLARAVGSDRADLSAAIATDTLAAALEAVGPGRLVLVTSDAGLAGRWRTRGVHVVADPGAGLNDAVAAGMRHAGPGARVAALLGDVPSLDAASLRSALAAAASVDESFVPDADGTGTVLRCGRGFTPRFGTDSAARHEADGAVRLERRFPACAPTSTTRGAWRRRAVSGWGRRRARSSSTGHLVGSGACRPPCTASTPRPTPGACCATTVSSLRFEAPAFEASGLRLLRLGQRLTVEVVDDLVVALHIVGVGPGQPIR